MEHRRQQAVDRGADIGVLHKLFDSKSAQARIRRQNPGQKAYQAWMLERNRDPLNPNPMDLINFLDHGLTQKRWTLTTVNNYKSAVFQLFSSTQQKMIKDDELFQRYLKVMGTNSVKRMYNTQLDLTPVLEGLRALGDNHSMTMKDLTTKLCFLLATCGLLRPDDLACTDVSQCSIKNGDLELVVVFPKEHRGHQMIIKPIVIKAHPVEAFCPVKTYSEYRARTRDQDRFARRTHPKSETVQYTPLVRHLRRFNLALTSERISKYIQEIMQLIPRQPDQRPLKARAVGATAALSRGIPVDDVMTQGNWSSPAIVEEFYRISRNLSNNFSSTIMS